MNLLRGLSPAPQRRIADYVAYHARQRPEKTAILNGDMAFTYATLHRDLARMTAAVATFGLKAGQIAAIGHADLRIQLLMIFAFETLGIVTGSFRPREGDVADGLLKAADLVLVEQQIDFLHPRKVLITRNWVDAALAAPMPGTALHTLAPFRPLVIYRSSGTTGQPKLMILTTVMLEQRLARQRRTAFGASLNRETRFFAVMHFSVGSIYMAAVTCLRAGGCFIADAQLPVAVACVNHGPTHMILLPYQLRQILVSLPAGAVRAPVFEHLNVQIIGGHVPEDLRTQALQTFCRDLQEVYGTNEIGAIGDIGANGAFALRHGIEAEIAGEDGERVQPGIAGRLRVRSQSMVSRYLDDASTSDEKFLNGWFYPGDVACMSPDGSMRLLGRSGDIMNIGGIKIAATEIESRLLAASPRLLDIAVLQYDIDPMAPVAVCIVAAKAFQLPHFVECATPILNCRFTVRKLPQIPRTSTGKIRRDALREQVLRLAGEAKVACCTTPF